MFDCVSTGESSLATLHCFLSENFDWFVSQLNITPLLLASDMSSITRPVLSLSQQPQRLTHDSDRPSRDFNPLKMFASIGRSPFNHVRMADFVTDFFYLFITFVACFIFLQLPFHALTVTSWSHFLCMFMSF